MNRDEVARWFSQSTDQRRRFQDPDPESGDEFFDAWVRRPERTGKMEEQEEQTGPGAGEWRGATYRIRPARLREDRAYIESAQRVEEFRDALAEAQLDPDFDGSEFLQAIVDSDAGFRDRRFEGRRYRPTNNEGLREGHQNPYPHPGEIDPRRYLSF